MNHKELGSNVEGSTRVDDGSTKIAFRKKAYDVEAISLAKVDAAPSRPCAIIGPDRVLPPSSNDMYMKKSVGGPWAPTDNVYRHPPEYPSKVSDYQPTRNISPRQTFQENMKRIMVPPTYDSMKSSEASSLRNAKPNMPQEAKYSEVPYSVNSVTNELKTVRNPDIPMSTNTNPAFARNIPPPYGWPAGVNVRPLRPYATPEYHQYTELSSCAGPRPMSMIRPSRSQHEDSAQAFSDRLYQDANIRFKPYPTGKEPHQQSRYDYMSNYPNTFHPPTSYPPHKFDIQKNMPGHPYPVYPQVPMKYLNRSIHEPFIEGYHRSPHQQINFNTFHNQIVPPPYGPVPGTCVQNKTYSEMPSKHMTINKMQFENNSKVYLNLDSSRPKAYPVPDNYFYNDINQPMRSEILLPGHANSNIHSTSQHPFYRKDNTSLKSYEYNPYFRNFEQSVNLNHSLPKVPLQFSPGNIAISPSDSNTSNDMGHNFGTLQEDCGYVSQSSTASARSLDSFNIPIPHDIYRRHSYNNYGAVPNTFHINGSEHISKSKINSSNKKNLNVRQFLQMWNEGDEEVNENNKEASVQNTTHKYPNQGESVKNQEQLYVLGLVNVPNEELEKYNHIQKISKLPENIKGYDNIEILNQYEQLLETPHLNSYNKPKTNSQHREYKSLSKSLTDREITPKIPRPISPLDVEAKISQSVIHKEVGCNFEIKPCSPEMLNVEVATPVQTLLGERIIEKVLNPIVGITPILSQNENSNAQIKNDTNKIPSCKLISSSQYMPDKLSADTLKPNNYTMQDLESNSSVCLASLPQLDNDIELNFPEINQQFIKANKIEPTLQDLPHLDLGQSPHSLAQKIETNIGVPASSQSHLHASAEKEFSKLSKYRRNKKIETVDKQETITLNKASASQRIDSVIIKNPDNLKIQDAEILTTPSNKIQEIEQHIMYYENNELSPATAIDFSLSKSTGDSGTKSCKNSLLEENKDTMGGNLENIDTNNVTSFLRSGEDILTEPSKSALSEEMELNKVLGNQQHDTTKNIQRGSSVNMLNEENNVPVIRKLVMSNLETHSGRQIVLSNVNNTEIIKSASINVSDETYPELSNEISETFNLEKASKGTYMNVKISDNVNLHSSDTELSKGSTGTSHHESVDGDNRFDTEINHKCNDIKDLSLNSCEILSSIKEKKTSDDLCLKKCLDKDISFNDNIEVEIESRYPNDINNAKESSHIIKEKDKIKNISALEIFDSKYEDNAADLMNDSKMEVETKTVCEKDNTTEIDKSNEIDTTSETEKHNIEIECYDNISTFDCDFSSKTDIQEKVDNNNLISKCESSHLEICPSSIKLSECTEEINISLEEYKQEYQDSKDMKVHENHEKFQNENVSLMKNDTTDLETLTIKSAKNAQNVKSISISTQDINQENVNYESEISSKKDVSLPLINEIVPLIEDPKFEQTSIEAQLNSLCDDIKENTDLANNKTSIEIELSPKNTSKCFIIEDLNSIFCIKSQENYASFDKVIVESQDAHNCLKLEDSVSKKQKINIPKELYSPWIQKLLTFTEGFYETSKCLGNTLAKENIFELQEETQVHEFNEINESNIHDIEVQHENSDAESKYTHSQGLSFDEEESDVLNPIIISSLTDCSKIKINKLKSDSVLETDICNKKENVEKLIDVNENGMFSKPRKILKRSLSESALEQYKDDEDSKSLQPCKRTRTNPTFLQSHIITEDICNIIQTNRRNSVSTFYNEENVYIVIDNDLILTEDESAEKICYTEITDDFSSRIEPTADNMDLSLTNDICIDESTKMCELSHSDNEDQHSDESWVEDVACMETVFSVDVAENIIIDTQASPKKNDSINIDTENNETSGFYDSDHIDKIRNIYGTTMCNDDSQIIETLYKTPQKDVNKTLHFIESHNPEEFLENSYNKTDDSTYLESNNKNVYHAEFCKMVSFNEEKSNQNLYLSEKCELSTIPQSQPFQYTNNHDFETILSSMEVKEDDPCESNNEYVVSSANDDGTNYSGSSSPEVSSTTSEEKNSSILLKITNCNGSRVSEINEISLDKGNKISYKLTEKGEYRNYNSNFTSSRTLITKAAQKYIPPLKDLKVKLHLPEQRLNTLKQLKLLKSEQRLNMTVINCNNNFFKPELLKKPKPKFEDVLKSIDEINFKRHKHQSKKTKSAIPKVVIKKNENGAHYASNKTANRKETFNPDLTGRKWQPWVFLDKNSFIDGMALKNKVKAIYCHRKKCYILADKFRKYKSVYNANFVISQPNSNSSNTSKGNLKYTIRIKPN